MPRESIYKRYQPEIDNEPVENDYAYWFAFSSGKLLVKPDDGSIPYQIDLTELGLSPVRTQYLGRLRGKPCYSAELPPDIEIPEDLSLSELRRLWGTLDEDIYLLAGKAVQIVDWDRNHQYCGRCGHKTEPLPGERAKKCPACGLLNYPRLSPAVITAVLKGDKILLSHYAAFRGNMHTIIAGFVEPGETLEECVKREIAEEVSIRVKNIEYFGSQPWPFPNSLMIGFTAEYESGEIAVDGKEISEAGWYSADDLPELPPEMSIAREIINWFVRTH